MACSGHDCYVSLCTSQLNNSLKKVVYEHRFLQREVMNDPVCEKELSLCFLTLSLPGFSSVGFSFSPICCPFTSSTIFSDVSFVPSATYLDLVIHVCAALLNNQHEAGKSTC